MKIYGRHVEFYLFLTVLLESDLLDLDEDVQWVYKRHCRRNSQIVNSLTKLRKNLIYVLVR